MSAVSIPASSVQVVTDHYYWAHGKRPRGEGGWAFYMRPPGQVDSVSDPDQVFWYHGPYGEAKKAAQAEAVRRHQYVVWVAP